MRSGPPRSSARAWTLFVAVVLCLCLCLGTGLGACADYRREDGQPCLKSTDCLSDLCTASICSSPSPVLPGSSYPRADSGSPTQDTGAPPVDTGAPPPDTSTGSDASSDGPPVVGDASDSFGDARFARSGIASLA